jgi:hypothetical protein
MEKKVRIDYFIGRRTPLWSRCAVIVSLSRIQSTSFKHVVVVVWLLIAARNARKLIGKTVINKPAFQFRTGNYHSCQSLK